MVEHQVASTSDRRRRLTAVLMADMVGYSRRIEQDELQNSDRASRSIDLFKSLIGSYGGRVVQVAGDGILALFESSEEAIRFAVQVQSEFREQARWEDGEPIEFRVSANVGEVAAWGDGLHAHCINVAARIQPLAEPGKIVATDGVRGAVRNLREVSFRSLGSYPLKGISDVVEVFAVDPAGRTEERSAPRPDDPRRPPVHQPETQPSVAALTLLNRTGDPANDTLCDILVEGVISDLSRFRSLTVIARHSAALFNPQTASVQEIGQRLRARYLLGGSLHRAGGHLRAIVQLIEAESENVIWSDRFDIAIDQLFEIQDEITGAVASRLSVQIDFAEHRNEAKRPGDMRSYGLVVRGHELVLRFAKPTNLHARRIFEEAAALAPNYGRAHSAISRTHNLDWRYAWSPDPMESLETALETAHRAIHLDRLDSRAFAELGFANLYRKRHEESLADYRRAIALNPNDADVLAEYADSLVYAGDPSSAIGIIERAMRLNPYFPDWYLWYLADAQDALGQHAEVIATVNRMQNPDEGRRLMAANYAHLGMMEEARAQGRAVLRLHPDFRIKDWADRPPYKDQTVFGRYIDGLRKAGLP